MNTYKIYKKGNFLEIVYNNNGRVENCRLIDSRIKRHDSSRAWYDVFVNDIKIFSRLYINQIQKEDGSYWAENDFNDFITCSLGKSIIGESCEGFINLENSSDVTFDGTFNNIIVPDGANLNDVLLLIETYIDNNPIITLGVNCLGLAEGSYSVQEVFDAVNGQICSLQSAVTDLETNVGTLQTDLSTLQGELATTQGELADLQAEVDALEQPFKFVKEFETNLDGSIITISQAELTSCATVPNGCLYDGITQSFADLNIQVWIRSNDGGLGAYWEQGDNSTISYIRVNATTGLISIQLTGGAIDVIARVVIKG
jgi:hypothetical protein